MPFFGGGPSWVLTRMHTRYDQQTLSEDLLFRSAKPVMGGRANWDGTRGDQGAMIQDGGTNNFQGRYIIRHNSPAAVQRRSISRHSACGTSWECKRVSNKWQQGTFS
jgi:hypothetical protein